MQCILNRIHINLASASPLDPVESEDFRLQQEAAAESMKNYVTETHWATFGHQPHESHRELCPYKKVFLNLGPNLASGWEGESMGPTHLRSAPW